MPNFSGQLNRNQIYTSDVFGAFCNMIISQEVFADNIKGMFSELLAVNKEDGTLYGDTKLYYATNVAKSREWGGDAEAVNYLAMSRPEDIAVQSIVLDQYRVITMTLDNFLTKQGFMNEGSFADFNGVQLQWLRETKKVFETTIFNTYVGTTESEAPKGVITWDISDDVEDLIGLEKVKMEALAIARKMADLCIDLKDISKDYNDYSYLRSYDTSDLIFCWNSAWLNKIRKVDLPTIFHNEGLVDNLDKYVLPGRYFGDVNTTSGTADGSTIRSLIETDYTVSSVTTHVFAGDLLPSGATYEANTTYTVNDNIALKVMAKGAVPYMNSFEIQTDFFNYLTLTNTYALIWGYNTLEYLKGKPFITIKIEE